LVTIRKDSNDILVFLESLITNQRSEFKNSRWRIQNGGCWSQNFI